MLDIVVEQGARDAFAVLYITEQRIAYFVRDRLQWTMLTTNLADVEISKRTVVLHIRYQQRSGQQRIELASDKSAQDFYASLCQIIPSNR